MVYRGFASYKCDTAKCSITIFQVLITVQVEDIVNETRGLKSSITSTEEFVRMSLDGRRNALIRTELGLTIGTLSVSCGSFVASVFGMNLPKYEYITESTKRLFSTVFSMSISAFQL